MLSLAHQLSAGALPSGEGWRQTAELGLALVLSATIGLEREVRQKSAGLRTHTLVGVGAALFMLVSKYGFMDVLVSGRIVLDPSRIAAQVVSGIGFLGAGLIFVRRDAVRGLTTAAGVWITAAIGMAAGAGLPILAVLAAVTYLIVALVFPMLTRYLPRSDTAISVIRMRYPDGRGILRQALQTATARGFAVDELSVNGLPGGVSADGEGGQPVEVTLQVHGRGSVNDLASVLTDIPGVRAVIADDVNAAA
ncbi:MAG: MgtC/SapB family protein [Streptosporangiaceae bacterium]